MKKINLSYLNSKMIYRALKVVYILCLIILLFLFNGSTFSESTFKTRKYIDIDNDKTVIICNNDGLSFFPREKEIHLDKDDFNNEYFEYEYFYEHSNNESTIKTILKNCGVEDTDNMDVFLLQRAFEIMQKTNDEEVLKSELQNIEHIKGAFKTKYLDYSFKFFNIKPAYKEYGGEVRADFIIELIMGNVFILLAFETVRRMFYYIVLGKTFPKE